MNLVVLMACVGDPSARQTYDAITKGLDRLVPLSTLHSSVNDDLIRILLLQSREPVHRTTDEKTEGGDIIPLQQNAGISFAVQHSSLQTSPRKTTSTSTESSEAHKVEAVPRE
jgi:hypothetical protein